MGLDTKTYWLTDRQSQCDFDFDLNLAADKPTTVQVSNCRFSGLNKSRHRLLHCPALTDVPVYSRTLCQFVLWIMYNMYGIYPLLYVTSGGKRCSKGTPIIKKSNTSHFIKGETTKEEKNKSLDTEQIYGHGSQRGSVLGVTVLAGCRQ
jgi:hypothetical protein